MLDFAILVRAHKDKDLEFVKGWLKNQVSDFKSLFIEI